MSQVAAVIVLYQPDLPLLRRLLQSLDGQVEELLVVDNSPSPDAGLGEVVAGYRSKSRYVALGENKGVAFAHNAGIREAIELGASHVLLLDQDSALPSGMVQTLLKAEEGLLARGTNVAAVGPVFIDEKTGEASTAVRHRYLRVRKPLIGPGSTAPVETDYLIASGCLVRVAVLKEVGMMRDELFIDWVDIEWGLRARQRGRLSYIIPQAAMSHSIGDATVRAVNRNINLHNDTRNYYIVRNATYLLRESGMGWSWRCITALKIPQYVVFYSWHSPGRWRSLGLLCRAFMDGLSGRLGRMA